MSRTKSTQQTQSNEPSSVSKIDENEMKSTKSTKSTKQSKSSKTTGSVQKDKPTEKVVVKTSSEVKKKSDKKEKVVEPVQPIAEPIADSLNLKFREQHETISEEVKKLKASLVSLTSSLHKLETAYNADIKKVRKIKSKRTTPHKPTGFIKPKPVPEKLAKFIGVEVGAELTRPEVTKRVWSQLIDRGLTNENDKRIFKTNTEVSKVFNIPDSVNKSTHHRDKDGFNFCNLQKFIANAMK